MNLSATSIILNDSSTPYIYEPTTKYQNKEYSNHNELTDTTPCYSGVNRKQKEYFFYVQLNQVCDNIHNSALDLLQTSSNILNVNTYISFLIKTAC